MQECNTQEGCVAFSIRKEIGPGDDYSLSEIIISMYLRDGNPDWMKIKSLSKNALNHSEMFSWENSAKKIISYIEKLV